MKILQIAPPWIDTPPKNYGGTEWVISNLVEGFVKLGHDVTLFATKKSQSTGELDYVFHKSLTNLGVPWTSALPPLLHYHQAFQTAKYYDIVHAHLSSETDIIILPFLFDLISKGLKGVLTIHGHWPFDRHSHMDRFYLKHYSNKITALSISKSMQKTLPQTFINGGVVHNSLDARVYKFQNNKGRYLTWLGKIVPDKGVHQAILVAKRLGIKFVFAGVVDKFYEPSIKYFKTKVQPLIDGKQVIYLGPANLKTKNQMLGSALGFLNPINWEEPFGMVMLESMACGTPVISFARGAAPELIKNGRTGFLVDNSHQMALAIKNLPSIQRENCRKHVEENFSPEVAAAKHLIIYKRLIKQHPTEDRALLLDFYPDFKT